MKKIILVLCVFLCATAVSVDLMVGTNKDNSMFDLDFLKFQAKADPEIPPLDKWDATEYKCPEESLNEWGRNCIRVAVGSPDCFNILCVD
jgi:hypothetical protein